MPIIELDLIIGFLSDKDKNHIIATKIFHNIKNNALKDIKIPTSALLELELVLKSKRVPESEITKDIIHLIEFPNISEFPLDSRVLVLAQKLRAEYFGLTFFDSLHCASALLFDNTIINTDQLFDNIHELKRIPPDSLIDSL